VIPLLVALAQAEPGVALVGDDAPALTTHVVIAGGGFLYMAAMELGGPVLGPAACAWCAPGPFDRQVRDDWRWAAPETAEVSSSIGVLAISGAAVVGAFARGGPREQGLADAVYVVEALALTGVVNETVKLASARQRPYAWALAEAGTPVEDDPDANRSFYSQHTSLAFAAVASAGTLAALRKDRAAPWIWGVGIPLAAGVGYLRVAADSHWFSDVAVGAVVGTASGVLVPVLLHPRATPDGHASWEIQVVPGTTPMVVASGTF